MNLVDITIIAESLLESNIDAVSDIFESNVELLTKGGILKGINSKVTQKLMTNGNFAIIARACCEHPEGMIKEEINIYSEKLSEELTKVIQDLLESESKLFSIKKSTFKIL